MAIGCALYAMAFVPALVALIRKREYSHCLFLLFLLAGFLFQSFGLYLRGVTNHDFPLQNTFEVFQVVAWLAVAFNFVARLLFRLPLLNFFASGLALSCSAVSLCVPDWDRRFITAMSGSPWVEFHAGLAIASYAIFSVLALTSVMYLIQDHALARRKSGALSLRLPAIGQLEAVNTKLIVLGVSLLTISMGVGALNMWEGSSNVRGIKLAIACTVWLGYLIILILRRRRHLVGRPFARACVTVFLYAICLLWPLTYRPPAAEQAASQPTVEQPTPEQTASQQTAEQTAPQPTPEQATAAQPQTAPPHPPGQQAHLRAEPR